MLLHQSLHALLRVFLVMMGQVADAETNCSARHVQHGLCMRETTAARVREVNNRGEYQLELELTSHQRVSSGGVAVERGKEAAKREESPRTQHLSCRQAPREDLRTNRKIISPPAWTRSVSRIRTETGHLWAGLEHGDQRWLCVHCVCALLCDSFVVKFCRRSQPVASSRHQYMAVRKRQLQRCY